MQQAALLKGWTFKRWYSGYLECADRAERRRRFGSEPARDARLVAFDDSGYPKRCRAPLATAVQRPTQPCALTLPTAAVCGAWKRVLKWKLCGSELFLV